MKLRIFDYQKVGYDTEYDLDDIDRVVCNVVSGDEVLIVSMKDGTTVYLDAASFSHNPRSMSYYDGTRTITQNELHKWNKRTRPIVWYW